MAKKKTKQQSKASGSASKKKAAPAKGSRSASRSAKTPKVKTEYDNRIPATTVTAIVSMVLFILFLVICINPDGVVLKAIGSLLTGLVGRAGFYFSVPALLYLFIILVVSMAMHMLLGSSITTMSVVVPSLLIIADGVAPTPVLLFSIYIMASAHCVLPFHNVITMIGEGRGCFRSRDMLRCGLSATAPILLAVLFLFYGWWRLMGA